MIAVSHVRVVACPVPPSIASIVVPPIDPERVAMLLLILANRRAAVFWRLRRAVLAIGVMSIGGPLGAPKRLHRPSRSKG